MSERAPADAHPTLPADWRLVALDSVGSTNDEARALAAAPPAGAGAPHGTVVWARRQEAGRGRRGRAWASPEGNLYCSTVLRPDCSPSVVGTLTFVVALAIADAVGTFLPERGIALKWPNDVLVDGSKVCGILLDNALTPDRHVDWVIAGTGVNIASRPENTAFPATSLREAGAGRNATPEAVLEVYAAALDRRYTAWRLRGFAPVREAWLARVWGRDRPLAVRLESETVSGRFEDLDEAGNLVLRLDDGRSRRIAAGDVFFGGD